MKINGVISYVLVAILSLSSIGFVFADEELEDFEEVNEGEAFLNQVKSEYNLSKADYKNLLNDIADTESRLDYLASEHETLQAQMREIDVQIKIGAEKYLAALKMVLEQENEIRVMDEEIQILDVRMEHQKGLLADYIEMLYIEENEMFSLDKEDDGLRIFLQSGSVGENVQRLEYLNLLSEGGERIIGNLDASESDLKKKRSRMIEEKSELEELVETLELNKGNLENQKESKKRLMEITSNQEAVYSELLAESRAQQEKMVEDLRELNELVLFVEDKMIEEGVGFNPENYQHLLSEENRKVFEFNLSNLGSEAAQMYWPVEPKLGISAYFRNPADGYQARFGVAHSAIDLPINQGTPIRAAADGVVFKAKDNGYGYSYISVVHAGDLVTNYGHMSKLLVEDGQFVSAGSIIGLSGGMPGTLGAGYMTTGPHLHFEVMKKGVHVDPMYYLPLEILKKEHTGNMPKKYEPLWKEAVEKAEREAVAR